MEQKKILITGMAGFIGFSLAKTLMATGKYDVTGLDNLNDYYDTQLKYDRLKQLGFDAEAVKKGTLVESEQFPHSRFIQLDLEDLESVTTLFQQQKFDKVVHLAAQAGVRHSLSNPHLYVRSNITGFLNILECCRQFGVAHLIYASSSSVYGQNSAIPFSEDQLSDQPVSLYAVTKRSNELMAHTYHHLYALPVTGLRFFTVYGPWGRPDMSPMLFAKAIREGKPIKVFNHGNMRRDFTFIDDIVDGICRVLEGEPKGYRIYNIGNSKPVELLRFIELMEEQMGIPAVKELLPMQPGDVYETYADVSALTADTGYRPSTSLETGIGKFLEWYLDYYPASEAK